MMNRISNKELTSFKRAVWRHYAKHKRDFPWRNTTDPYRVLVSEIMLQQTQAARVVEKYHQFLEAFPTVASLAQADNQRLFSVWQGLGYNCRALQLKKLAQTVTEEFGGKIPSDETALLRLPGIGPATAAAIRAFAFNLSGVYLDTNVRRVYLHCFFPGQERVHDRELTTLIEATLSRQRAREWGWALLDYGAMLGRDALVNPNRRSAHYAKQSAFKGSRRQLRGAIMKILVKNNEITLTKLQDALAELGLDLKRDILDQLIAEGYIKKQGAYFSIRR